MALIQHKLRDRSLFKNNRQGRVSAYGTPIDGQTIIPSASPPEPSSANLLIDNVGNFFIDENNDFIEVV